jgi:predicted RNA-binding Zn ribbon-like protein
VTQKPIWKEGFLFIGNQLALDFVNTRPVQNEEAVELLPDFKALMRWFHAADLLSNRETARIQEQWDDSRGRSKIQAIWELREGLRKEILAWEGNGTLQGSIMSKLNRLLAEHPMLTRLKMTGNELSKELYFEVKQPEDLFAPLAYRAARLFTELDRDRIRKCGNCILHFHDTSKKGTRRWCSMQLCGNRLKVAAYTARQRSS